MNGNNLFYWDTCIFYTWLLDEKRQDGELDAIEYLLAKNKRNDNIIITSTLTICEVLQGKIPEDKEKIFQECLKRRSLRTIAVDIKIAEEARRIRDYYHKNKPKANNICTPDAIHLATAIIYNVDEFHTFDLRNTKGCKGLLPLNGNVAGHNLTIIRPNISMYMGPLFKGNEKTDEE